MIDVTFFLHNDSVIGYELSGHSDYAENGSDIVCAAVSSAAFLTANNITDFLNVKADVTVSDGYMRLTATDERAKPLIDGLYAHLLQLKEQYNNDIKVKTTEV